MKKTIWKFPLESMGIEGIPMPIGAEILTIQTQSGKPCMWALVDPDAKVEPRYLEVFGTGHPIHYDMGIDRKFIGTYQIMEGTLIFHVFERL